MSVWWVETCLKSIRKRGERKTRAKGCKQDQGSVAAGRMCSWHLACPPRRAAAVAACWPRPQAAAAGGASSEPLLQGRRSRPLPHRAALWRACRCARDTNREEVGLSFQAWQDRQPA